MPDSGRVAWMDLQEMAVAMRDDAGIIPGDIVQHPGSGKKPGAFWIPLNLIREKRNGSFLW
jgi:hypothetical protein